MRIVMLSGGNSCGKTSTLNVAYQTLLAHHGVSRIKEKLGGNKMDFRDVVQYKEQLIAFFTMGDFSRELIEAIVKYDKERIDIMICACNKKFVNPYNKIKSYHHNLLEKTLATAHLSEVMANLDDAKRILALL